MVVVFLTAIPMSIITDNVFLFLIGMFSFYFAFAGKRLAQNRSGIPNRVDWIAVIGLLLTGVGMLLLAFWYFVKGNTQYVALLVLGTIAVAFAYANFNRFKQQSSTGKRRIANHLSMMLGGTIAVVTAVLVVNISVQPAWILWLLPTAIGTPAIIWWNRRVLR